MIWLASFPRSGNTFFRNVLHEVYGLTSSTYHHDPSRPSDADFADHPVVKTHLLPGQLPVALRGMPAVYLIRDGRDALVSIAHHRKDIVAPGTDFYNNLLEASLAQNGSFFGGWSRNVQEWSNKAAIVIHFEDLITDPIREVEKLRAIIDLPAPDLTKLPTFQSLRNGRPAYGGGEGDDFSPELVKKHFRSGKTGGWKKEVSPELQRLLNTVHGKTLQQFGYTTERFQSELPERRIVIEASKLFTSDNDGIKRYLAGLRQGLTPLLPYFPHLNILLADRFGTVEVRPPDTHQKDDFKALTELETIVTDRRKMGYEKGLLLFKLAVKKILPGQVYQTAANFYRTGPFRAYLVTLKRSARKTTSKLSGESFEDVVKTADIIHLPLPQHLTESPPSNSKTLVTVHDFSHRLLPEFHEKANVDFAEQGMQLAINAGAHFLSVSTATQADLVQLYQPSAGQLHLVTEAADTTLFNREASKADLNPVRKRYGIPSGPYLMCLSTIEPRKNLANTIQAFLQLKETNPEIASTLVICGKKGWKTEDLFKGLAIDRPDIVFTGFVNDEDLPALYAHARALCYVSVYEGFGLPIVEAMACGTPVIFGNNSSQPEVAGDGGIGVAADDVRGITAAMHKMLTDDNFHAEKAEAAWRQANTFSWLKTALLTLDAYERILNDAP
jgi:glycosyltransferase involved in cell wall biosynthesis